MAKIMEISAKKPIDINDMNIKLDLKMDSQNIYSASVHGSYNFRAIYGGVILSQSIIAAYETISASMFLHSLHIYFLQRGDYKLPINYLIESTMDGRSFVKRCVSVRQNNNIIANVHLSFKVDEPSTLFKYIPTVPPTGTPDEYHLMADLIKDKIKTLENKEIVERLKGYAMWLSDFPFDVKPHDAEVQTLTLANSTNKLFKWVRLKDEKLLKLEKKSSRHALLGFISDYAILQPILTMCCDTSVGFMVSLDHVMWFHNHTFDARDWLLLETECNIADNGTSLNNGRIWSKDGLLLASFMQEGIIRPSK